jgi:hypothetical protein
MSQNCGCNDNVNSLSYIIHNANTNLPAPPSCPNPEPCDEFVKSGCVVIDRDLTVFGIKKDDRLNQAIEKINLNSLNIMVAQDDTSTLDMQGDGTSSSPLKGVVKVSAKQGNVITVEPDGLAVVFTKALVQQLLYMIKSDADLFDYMCKQIIRECGLCPSSSNVSVTLPACQSALIVEDVNQSNHNGITYILVTFRVSGATMAKLSAGVDNGVPALVSMTVLAGNTGQIAFNLPTGTGNYTIKLSPICASDEKGTEVVIPITV